MIKLQEESVKIMEKPRNEPYLDVRGLKTYFFTEKGVVKALDGVDISIAKGEIYGLVGESGCGKSVTALSIMDLVKPPGAMVSGNVSIEGYNVASHLGKIRTIKYISDKEVVVKTHDRAAKKHDYIMSNIRGRKVSMIFQEPTLALNPVLTIGDQIVDAIMAHNKKELADAIIRMESLRQRDIENIVDSCRGLANKKEISERVGEWCWSNGLPDLTEFMIELIESSLGRDTVVDKISKEIMEVRSEKGMGIIIKTSENEANARRFFELTLRSDPIRKRTPEHEEMDLGVIKSIKQLMRDKIILFKLEKVLFGWSANKRLREQAWKRGVELLRRVRLSNAESIMREYPHELSGGMQQRCLIAMALSADPMLLLADEPTTALDVTTQFQILKLIRETNLSRGISVLFITHDLAVVASLCHRVGVMYAGSIVEESSVEDLFRNQKHPYTSGLMRAIPRPNLDVEKRYRFESIGGSVPNLIDPPSGCRFHPRCKFRMDICDQKKPKLVDLGGSHRVACFLYSDDAEGDVNE